MQLPVRPPPPTADDLMNSGAFGWPLTADTPSTAPANLIANPNILMIMVDQLRLPTFWLSKPQQDLLGTICPNIIWLQQTSYRFWNFYVCAQACTPSRATLLTGLYAPQTGVFATQSESGEPDLNPGFPTFGTALQDIAGYDPSNIMWFGKWHVSHVGTNPLHSYGFNTGRQSQILWPSVHGSPNGSANQGNNGYLYPNNIGTVGPGACDDSIVNDFVNNWTHNPPISGKPWFACVSFVNPHDIHSYPGFFPPTTADANHPTGNPNGNDAVVPGSQGTPMDYPAGEPVNGNYQPAYGNYTFTTPLFSTTPTGFNWESSDTLKDKSWDVTATIQDKPNFLQPYFQQDITDASANLTVQPGSPSHATILGQGNYADFLNWYYYMISLVDANIGTVLSTVFTSLGLTFSNTSYTNPSNTAIIFLSDHSDYAGSHGLHSKGGAVYDEALRVPLFVVTPSQSGSFDIFQMCSIVDIFRLVVELALGNTYNWSADAKYVDQHGNTNESLFSFIQSQLNGEARGFPDASVWYPFILTTTDETFVDAIPWQVGVRNVNCALRSRVICMRTKSDADHAHSISAYSGGKLAIYSKWVLNPSSYSTPIVDGTLPYGSTVVQDYEYYDYENYGNRTEVSYTPPGGSPTGSDYLPALQSQNRNGSTINGAAAQHLLGLMTSHFGNMQIETSVGPPPVIQPATGYVATMLTRQLTGVSNSVSLSTYTSTAIQNWYNWLHGFIGSTCTS